MLKMGLKSLFAIVTVSTLYTCIDPFNPLLTGDESLLVVDGLITDANSSYSVTLSMTVKSQDSYPAKVSDATVFISDDAGSVSYLRNWGNGYYKTDSLSFRGVAGRTYVLHILTNEGKNYESEPCFMQPGTDIDSIYFEKDRELVNNGRESQDGIRIYLNSKYEESGSYYRWDFEETWKFNIPDPKRYDYIDEKTITRHFPVNRYCWKGSKSDKILIKSACTGNDDILRRIPLHFIASDKSDRLLVEYSILVRQYTVSNNEYDFWSNILEVSEAGSDIFGIQPYPVAGNIHNINNPDEKVLGFFQVAGVKEKREFIPISEIAPLHLPYYHYECERIARSPSDYPYRISWDEIYSMYCITSDYSFVEPLYDPTGSQLSQLVFTRPECADCGLTGSPVKPDFWIDLN